MCGDEKPRQWVKRNRTAPIERQNQSRQRAGKKLYSHTVQYFVYRLYHQGIKLQTPAVRQHGPAIGRHAYCARQRESALRNSIFMAQLLANTTNQYVIPVLDDAALVRLDERGMLFVGKEIVPRGVGIKTRCDYYAQAWLCKPKN